MRIVVGPVAQELEPRQLAEPARICRGVASADGLEKLRVTPAVVVIEGLARVTLL